MNLLNSTVQNEIYEYLSRDASLFHFLQEKAIDGLFLYDIIEPNKFWMNPKLYKTLGYDFQSKISSLNVKQAIFREDLEDLKLRIEEEIEEFESEIRFRHSSGYNVWMKAHFKILKDEEDQSLKLLGGLKVADKHTPKAPKLERQIERYKHIIEGTNIGLWEWNVQTGETIFHPQWAHVLGYTLDELQPASTELWKKLSHPDDREKCNELLKKHFEGLSDFYECECRMKHKNGDWIWVEDKGKVVTWTEDGKPEWMTGFHEEINEMKERLLLKRSFIKHAPSAIAMFDKEMNYIAVSNRWLEDYNIAHLDVTGKNHYEIFPEISDEWKEIHKRCLNGEILKKEEDHFVGEDGSEMWINWEVRPWHNEDNKIAGLIMHTADISHTKKLENIAKEKQNFLETILKNINVGIIACDSQGKLTLFNKATRDWHGLPARDIPPSEYPNYYGLYKPDGETPLKLSEIPLLKALAGQEVNNDEIVIKPKNGQAKSLTVTGSQLQDENNNVTGAVVAMHDITELKNKEDKLRYSETIFRHTFDYAGTGMVMVDMQGNWARYNDRFLEILGFTAQELEELHFTDISHPEEREDNLNLFMDIVQGKMKYYNEEKRLLHKNGTYIPVFISGSVIHDEKNQPLYSVTQIIDNSLQKKAEERLRNTIARFEALLGASTRTMIVGTDTDGLITFYNTGAENLLGYTKDEMVGKQNPSIFHVKEEVIEVARELVANSNKSLRGFDIFKELVKLEQSSREWTLIRKDGSKLPVQLTITAIRENNTIVGYLGVGTDISELKRVENEIKSILKITQSQNERLKNFAHIVSHNLRSHAGNIEMLLNLFLEENPQAEEDEMMIHLNKASANLKETISHLSEVVLMNVSVKESLTTLNISKYIRNATENLMALAEKNDVQIVNEVPQKIKVLGIPAYLDSILLNFISNAIKYRASNRKSFVKIRTSETPDYVVLEIEDNGLGIDLKKHRRKLFGMYKTFHSNEDARGIGLFITKNQIEAMGGKIEVESELDKGTTFKIYLRYEKN